MAGTHRKKIPKIELAGPAIILVEPQLGENIGMVARAMLNCGLSDLRLVRPRDGWPSLKAQRASAGADQVIEGVQIFERTEDAIDGISMLFAATARPRDLIKPVLTPAAAALQLRAQDGPGAGVLFGGEAMGLNNDDITLADSIVQIPLNPGFSSLNLAQAVLIIAHAWFLTADETPPSNLPMPATVPASKEQLLGFFEQLENALDKSGFHHIKEKRPIMVRNLRNLFQRASLTEQEVRTLRGVISSLTQGSRGTRRKS